MYALHRIVEAICVPISSPPAARVLVPCTNFTVVVALAMEIMSKNISTKLMCAFVYQVALQELPAIPVQFWTPHPYLRLLQL
jgi:hypothetical protein